MNKYRDFLKGMMKWELIIGGMIVVVLVVLMCSEIVMRYFLNRPLIWVQEFVIFLFIMATSIGASIAVKTKSHIEIDTIIRLLPDSVVRILDVFGSVIVLGCLVFLMVKLPDAMRVQNMSSTSSLLINFPRGYYYSFPILLSVFGMFVSKVYYFFFDVKRMLGYQVSDDYDAGLAKNVKGLDAQKEEL